MSSETFATNTYSGVDYMYMVDYDFVTIRKQRNKEAETSFRAAIKHYIEGSWSEAQFFLG